VHQWLLATFPLQAQSDVWEDDPNTLMCGSYAPAANAARTARGFEISGKWSFASNCDNSDWALVGVMFPAEGDAKPKPGFLLIPRKDYELEDDWFTVSLAGTGSKSTVVREKLFVPEHRMLTFEQASSNNPPGAEGFQSGFCFAACFARLRSSPIERSSLCVATCHMWPKGSSSEPVRSP
jgi:hypothetical protein